MSSNSDMVRDTVLQTIDFAIDPKWMTKEQALEFLESVRDDIQSRMDAIKDDIARANR